MRIQVSSCTLIALLAFVFSGYSQVVDDINYDDLPTLKFKYGNKNAHEILKQCTPCILKTYDKKNNLIFEAVQQSDCPIGWFKKYDRKGNLITTGSYLPTLSETNKTGKCSIEHGQWIYMNWRGDTSYVEIWDSGQFISQMPPQEKVELWKVDFMLDEKEYKNKSIRLDQFNKLKTVLHYKNDTRPSKLIAEYRVSAVGFRSETKIIESTSTKDLELESILNGKEWEDAKEINVNLVFYLDGKQQEYRYFRVSK
jgi:antitoxin component YwqK of YwqJK toxin-antitoxin module